MQKSIVVGLYRRLGTAVVRNGVFFVARRCVEVPVAFVWQRVRRRLLGESQPPATRSAAADFDLSFDVETNHDWRDLAHLASSDGAIWKHAFPYQAVPEDGFRELMDTLKVDYKEYIFADLGSGKGRALFLAAQYPFKRVIGVEFSETLHTIAARNIEKFELRPHVSGPLESVCSDAGVYQFPSEPCVLFMNNPFDEVIMERVIENIKASHRAKPRHLVVAYFRARHLDVFLRQGFSLVKQWGYRGNEQVPVVILDLKA
ncbi:MAG: class I SAM-dependent methyltransferase [Myxococcales bacterium]